MANAAPSTANNHSSGLDSLICLPPASPSPKLSFFSQTHVASASPSHQRESSPDPLVRGLHSVDQPPALKRGITAPPVKHNKKLKLWDDGSQQVWSQIVHDAFMEALHTYPPIGKRRFRGCNASQGSHTSHLVHSTSYSRYDLIQYFIYQKTRKLCTLAQIFDYIQQMRIVHEDNAELYALLHEDMEPRLDRNNELADVSTLDAIPDDISPSFIAEDGIASLGHHLIAQSPMSDQTQDGGLTNHDQHPHSRETGANFFVSSPSPRHESAQGLSTSQITIPVSDSAHPPPNNPHSASSMSKHRLASNRPFLHLQLSIPPTRPPPLQHVSNVNSTPSLRLPPTTPLDQMMHTPLSPPAIQRNVHGRDLDRLAWAPTPTEGVLPFMPFPEPHLAATDGREEDAASSVEGQYRRPQDLIALRASVNQEAMATDSSKMGSAISSSSEQKGVTLPSSRLIQPPRPHLFPPVPRLARSYSDAEPENRVSDLATSEGQFLFTFAPPALKLQLPSLRRVSFSCSPSTNLASPFSLAPLNQPVHTGDMGVLASPLAISSPHLSDSGDNKNLAYPGALPGDSPSYFANSF